MWDLMPDGMVMNKIEPKEGDYRLIEVDQAYGKGKYWMIEKYQYAFSTSGTTVDGKAFFKTHYEWKYTWCWRKRTFLERMKSDYDVLYKYTSTGEFYNHLEAEQIYNELCQGTNNRPKVSTDKKTVVMYHKGKNQ